MRYRVTLAKEAKGQFSKLNDPMLSQVKNALLQLAEMGLGMNNIKRLTGNFSDSYRLRIGKYRIVFIKDEQEIIVKSILPRGNVYRP